jgi:hypothetical protein
VPKPFGDAAVSTTWWFAGTAIDNWVVSGDSCVVSCPIADFGSDVHDEGANWAPG